MRNKIFLSSCALAALVTASLLGGCGGDGNQGSVNLTTAAKVGNATCLQANCHATTRDLTMTPEDGRTIAAVYQDSVHNTPDFNPAITGLVQCEDCHGGGQFHNGAPGTIAYPVPGVAQCVTCHKPPFGNFPTDFPLTAHANSDQFPDKFFFTGGTGTILVNAGDGAGTSVTHNQRIEECSVCHDSNQRFVYDAAGNLTKPDPNNMPLPAVACANCHDAHQVGKLATVATRPAGPNPAGNVIYPIYRKVMIAGAGPWLRPEIKTTAGQFSTTDIVCASCHTRGTLKYSQIPTHQENVHPQWSVSAHNDQIGVPWNELSLASYPLDLSVAGNANPGTCAKCHNGLSSPVFMDPNPVTRRPNAPIVVWNPTTATCVTCHDPHANGTGATKNVRVPAVMTNYTGAFLGVVYGNVFLDTQPLPANNGNSSVCIFCHQGRESGLSLFWAKLTPTRVAFGNISGNFKNNHYLGTAAMLWGTNAYEYAPNISGTGYTANFGHQATNCTGCHLANPDEINQNGGHFFLPNGASCNPCHSVISAATNLSNEPGTGFLNTNRATTETTNYSGNPVGGTAPISAQIRDLQNYVIALLAANGVYYDDTKNPYFFNVALTSANDTTNNHASANNFRQWTLPLYKAAFNIAIAVKANPSAAASTTYVYNNAGVRVPSTSQTLFPNKSAAVHNYKYIIQLLMDSYTDLYNNSTAGQIAAAQAAINANAPNPLPLPTPAALNVNRPAGTRQSVNYGAFVKPPPGVNPVVTYGGTYNPNQ